MCPEDLLKDMAFQRKLLDLLAGDPRFKGATGQAGPTGPTGKDGLPGKDGKDGKDGADGADGKDGKNAVLDMDALANMIKTQIPGITVRTLNSDGEIVDSEYVPPGGVLNLHHKPLGGK